MFRLRTGSERLHENSGRTAVDQGIRDVPCGRNTVVAGKGLPGTGHVADVDPEGFAHVSVREINDVFAVDVELNERQRLHAVREALGHFGDYAIKG